MGDIFFWVFMLVFELLIPLVMIVFGRMFTKAAPKNINYAFGYRTDRSMKNKDTWVFAHKCIGRIWNRWGWVLLAVSAVFMLIFLGRDVETVGHAGMVLAAVQLAALVIPIFIVEGKLKKTFDKNGYRRNREW